MTRWARGGNGNQKQPHTGSSWSDLKSSKSSDRSFSKVKEDRIKGGVGKDNLKTGRSEHVWKKTGSRFETQVKGVKKKLKKRKTFEDNFDESAGLAVQLEKMGDETNNKPTEKHEKPQQSGVDKSEKKKKTKVQAKSGLAAALEQIKKEMGDELNEEQEKEMTELLKKDNKREKRRLKRVDHREMGKVNLGCSS